MYIISIGIPDREVVNLDIYMKLLLYWGSFYLIHLFLCVFISQCCRSFMMPLKCSNFPVAPYFIHCFFGSSLSYYFTTVQQGSGEVNQSFLPAFCSVMARVEKCVSNFLIICHWIYSFYMVGSDNILFVLSVFEEV